MQFSTNFTLSELRDIGTPISSLFLCGTFHLTPDLPHIFTAPDDALENGTPVSTLVSTQNISEVLSPSVQQYLIPTAMIAPYIFPDLQPGRSGIAFMLPQSSVEVDVHYVIDGTHYPLYCTSSLETKNGDPITGTYAYDVKGTSTIDADIFYEGTHYNIAQWYEFQGGTPFQGWIGNVFHPLGDSFSYELIGGVVVNVPSTPYSQVSIPQSEVKTPIKTKNLDLCIGYTGASGCISCTDNIAIVGPITFTEPQQFIGFCLVNF